MVSTRSSSAEAFAHVMDNVINRPSGTPVRSALSQSGIVSMVDLLSLSEADLHNLTYKTVDPDGTKAPTIHYLSIADRNILKYLLYYHIHRRNEFNAIDDWSKITKDEFDDFRINPDYTLHPPVPKYSQKHLTSKPQSSTPSLSSVDFFKRGIKRDPSLFPALKDERFNEQWHRSMVTQARAQDVSEVLDPLYVPLTTDDLNLFNEKQKYMYAVLETKVETPKGKAIIRKHEPTYDAQRAYDELQQYHLSSVKASLSSTNILAYITSARISDGSWNGTTENFILNWQEQVRLYERLVPSADHLSDGAKRVLLQNAVHPLQELRQVKATAELLKAQTKKDVDYEGYVSLLLSAAMDYDSKNNGTKSRRQVYQHHIIDTDDDPDEDIDPFDIDTPVDTIQAFASNFKARPSKDATSDRTRMSKDKWFSLDQTTKDLWDKIDDKYKSIILGYMKPPSKPNKHDTSNFRPSKKPPFSSNRHVNLHEISAYDFLQANIHELDLEEEQHEDHDEESPPDEQLPESNDTLLINAATGHKTTSFPPGDIRRVMSKSSKRSVNLTNITYQVSYHKSSDNSSLSLVDRGANGGVAGTDVRVIFKTGRTVDIRGIDNHQCTDIDIGTVGGVVKTHKGYVIAIMHQYALLNKGSTIHSPSQLEWYKNDVNDKSIHVPGGLQRIQTLDGYVIPLCIKDGLARLPIRPYTDYEWNNLPHVFLTSEKEWDPSVLDHEFPDDEQWGDVPSIASPFDEYGDYKHRVLVQHLDYFIRHDGHTVDDVIDQCVLNSQLSFGIADTHFYDANETEVQSSDNVPKDPPFIVPKVVSKKLPDFQKLRPFFGWISPDIIKSTFEHTTQYARLPTGTILKKAFKSPNPALNVHRRNEPVACDIVYSDVPAIHNGSIAAVIFVGLTTQVTDVYGIKRDSQFVNTLEDNIIQRGAPNKLVSDRAKVIISNKIEEILRTLCIPQWQSEPYQQHQNPCERRYQTVKLWTNRILDRSGAPPSTWLLCLEYVCFLLNHTYNSSIKNVPLTLLLGSTVDISVLLRFYFWQPVYYKQVEASFPSDSKEGLGHMVGISEHVGHALTYKVLTSDTQVIIHRSLLRPVSPADLNLRAGMFGGEGKDDPDTTHQAIVKSRLDLSKPTDTVSNTEQPPPAQPPPSPVFNPEDLIGRTFLLDVNDDGERHRARIVKLIEDHESKVEDNPTRIKFLVSYNNDKGEEIITYNKILDYILKDEETDIMWKFRRIISHEGPLEQNHPSYNGSKYNVKVEWENGEITTEPLTIIAADDPVTCAIYAKENGLLDKPGWKRLKSIARREKMFTRMANQAKMRSFNTAPRYKYGYEVPRTYEQAIRLDERNKNTKWQDAVQLEMEQVNEYETFIDKGHHTKAKTPSGYKKIRVHLVFDVKHDGRHKARLVADGHLTDIPLDSVYSGVVSLRGFRLVVFLAELNQLQLWATDIGNAYLEAYTSEKVYIIAGPEFKELQGHILIISKALYGLRSSGARWHDRFADCVRELGFFPCKAEPDIWMRRKGNLYEYVAVYVDDLAIAMKNPKEFTDVLEQKHKFKLKGTGPISFHLGMDFHRDDDNTLCISPTKYIEKLVKSYEKLFGKKPSTNVTSPLEKGDHPELDTSELCDANQISQYQSMIGALQWIVTIGRFDVITAVMTMSGFRIAPRIGHLERLKRIYGYLSKMRYASIRVRTEEPDYSDLVDPEYDWSKSVYGEVEEQIPKDAPEPLGKHVTLTHYVDANLMHDVTTGRSVTGILHLINKTPIDWYSKKQATVETATYGSEFVAARICVEQIIDLRTTLRYLGVPIRERSYLFGDNKSVVDSSMEVHAKLHKRHIMLSFHRVREAVASGMIGFYFLTGDLNPADILSKHWGYTQIKDRLRSLLFWKGDTADITETNVSLQAKGE